MKSRVWLLGLFFFSILVAQCQPYEEISLAPSGVKGYLYDSESQAFVGVRRQVDSFATREALADMIRFLKQPYKGYQQVCPDDLTYDSIRIDNGKVIINFNQAYYDMASFDMFLSQVGIIRSFLTFDNIRQVEFYVNGIPLKTPSNRVPGSLGQGDLVLDYKASLDQLVSKEVVLYFANASGSRLVPVLRQIDFPAYQTIEEAIIYELMKGPTNDDLKKTFPMDTQLNHVYSSGGICYVDLDDQFQLNRVEGGVRESVTIYALVNTLVELPAVTQVQIMIDGEIETIYKGSVRIDTLLKKNFKIIE